MDGPTQTRTRAPAKINLFLHVVGRRSDGYHLLDSLVAFAAYCDEVSAQAGERISLRIRGPYADALDVGPDNLVLRAAQALAGEYGVARGAEITLTKNLPVAAGIGGGSADAAATLRVLSALWGADPDETTMDRLAVALGADVPVCLRGRTSQMSGIGDIVRLGPDLPPCGILLINPNRPLATPQVFGARRGPFSDPNPIVGPLTDAAALAHALRSRRNDLAPAAIELCPDIGRVIAAVELAQGCLLARLSGSGPTCFGLFETEDEAAAAALRIAADNPDWWVQPTRLLDGEITVERK